MSRWWRRAARMVAVVVVVAAGTFVAAGPASANICKDAPKPVAPKSGLPGMLTAEPEQVPDAAPDPFADPSVPIGDVYGYTWGWQNYDLGCGADFLRDPIAVTNTQTANLILSILGASVAGLGSLEQMAKHSSLDWMTTVTTNVAAKLQAPLLGVWLPLALLAVGGITAFRARRASYSDTLRTLVVLVAGVGVATFALVYPAAASKTVDRAVVGLSDVVGKQFSGSATDAVNRQSAYETWLTGNFGDAGAPIARELGPRLMSATHYSWSDMKRIEASPAAKERIDQAKAAEFQKVAAEIEDRDPAAYEVFTGRGERTGPALLGVFVAACMSLFVGMAMFMVLMSRVMMQALALAAPLAAVLGILPTHHAVLARLWDLLTAAAVAVAKFTVAGGAMALVLGAIQTDRDLSTGAKLIWIVVATVAAIVLTRPIRSFKTIVPGLDPNKSYLRAAASGVATYIGARMGAESGVGAAVAGAQATTGVPATDGDAAWRPGAESLPALPAAESARASDPVWTQMPTTTAPVQRPSAVPSATPPAANALPAGTSWAGVVVGGPNRVPVQASTERLALPPGPSAATSSGEDSGGVVTATPAAAGGGLDAPPGGDLPRPRPVNPVEAGAEVVYPAGVIVATDETPLYRRTGEPESSSPAEVYLALPEPDLAEDGTEHDLVMYRSTTGSHA